ncbi:uncharacterized protein LOC126884974 [Diabrotica virgifera virgifera]|uniref:Uncharacterized protein n=1 Tax=Diabrotica virgifera virgifera TaxID=50390 RepID=A0ABM5KAU9_DIAVI|nr:uncharacterized protein LOC126884974 [Diabrotica virgifera virgifera]
MKFIFLFLIAAVNIRFPSARSQDSVVRVWPSDDFNKYDCFKSHETCRPWPLGDSLGDFVVWTWDINQRRCVSVIGHKRCTPTKNCFVSKVKCIVTAYKICRFL